MERTDEVLIAAHRQGDETAFDELVRRHGDRLLGYLMRMSRTRQQAEDIFQETFRRVHEKADHFEGRGRFKSWLYSIASNAAIDVLRKRGREPTMASLNQTNDCGKAGCAKTQTIIAEGTSADPLQRAVLAEQKVLVRQALGKLPLRQRATLVLVYYQGLSYQETAQTLGCSLGTVKSQMFRALRTLAGLLADLEGTPE